MEPAVLYAALAVTAAVFVGVGLLFALRSTTSFEQAVLAKTRQLEPPVKASTKREAGRKDKSSSKKKGKKSIEAAATAAADDDDSSPTTAEREASESVALTQPRADAQNQPGPAKQVEESEEAASVTSDEQTRRPPATRDEADAPSGDGQAEAGHEGRKKAARDDPADRTRDKGKVRDDKSCKRKAKSAAKTSRKTRDKIGCDATRADDCGP